MELLIYSSKDEVLNDIEKIVENAIQKHFPAKEPATNEPEYLTRKETANKYRISLVTLNRYTQDGTLTAYTIGGRVLYRTDQLQSQLTQMNRKFRR